MKKGQVKYGRGYQPRRYLEKRGKEKSWRRRMIFFWILFLVLVLGYLLFFSPIFEIKEIKISGNRVISDEEIQGSLDNQNNIFLISESRLAKVLAKDFPRILLVEVNKNIIKRIINLKIIERKEAGIFCKKDCYYIDKDGVIFEKAPQTSGTLILAIKDYSEGEVEIGKAAIEKEFMVELINLRDYLSNQLNLKVLDFAIGPDVSKDFKINTHEGWYVLFDRSRGLENQIEALQLVLEEKIGENRSNLEYIDLKIENRVYYK